MLLSSVIPVFNEIATLGRALAAVAMALPGVAKQIVIVDDASTDGTRDWLRRQFPGNGGRFSARQLVEQGALARWAPSDNLPDIDVRIIFHDRNRGKGGALQSGFAAVTGDIVVVHDADLEYDQIGRAS